MTVLQPPLPSGFFVDLCLCGELLAPGGAVAFEGNPVLPARAPRWAQPWSRLGWGDSLVRPIELI
jgi:hypothetical protein